MKMAKKWTALLFAAVFLALGTATPALALDLTQEPNINDYFDATLVPDVYDETINVAAGGSIQAAIDQAVTNREQGKSTRILLADGIYRETVNLNDNTHNAADSQPFITVEAAPNATPVISGALPVTGWVKAGDGTYTASLTDEMINLLTDNGALPEGQHAIGWPDNVGITSLSIWTNGALFAGESRYYRICVEEERAPGGFWMDFTAKTLTVWPKNNDFDPAKAELACRRTVFHMGYTQNIILRGITFTSNGWLWRQGLDIFGSKNCLIENVICVRNRDTGVGIYGANSDIALLNVDMNENGVQGMGVNDAQRIFYKDCRVTENNWVASQFNFTTYHPNGTKHMFESDSVLVDCEFSNNYGEGLWFDTWNKDITILRCTFANNRNAGLFLEANPGPFYVKDCVSYGNDTGFSTSDSDFSTFDGCTVYGNAYGISFNDHLGKGRGEGVWGPGTPHPDLRILHADNLTIKNCTISVKKNPLIRPGRGGGQFLMTQRWADTYIGENNKYFSKNPLFAFYASKPGVAVYDYFYGVYPLVRYSSLRSWQKMLGQDLNSTMNKGEAPPALEQKISLPCVTFMRKGETVDLDYSGVKTDGAVSWEVSPNLNITCRGSGILTMDASKLPFGMAIVTAKYGDQTARSLVIALPW